MLIIWRVARLQQLNSFKSPPKAPDDFLSNAAFLAVNHGQIHSISLTWPVTEKVKLYV